MSNKKEKRQFSIQENYGYSVIVIGIFFLSFNFLLWESPNWLEFRLWILLSFFLGTVTELMERKNEKVN